MSKKTISLAISDYIDLVASSRSGKTAHAYRNGLNIFSAVLKERWLDPETTPTEKLTEDAISWFAAHLKVYASATESLYVTAVRGFYDYLSAEKLADVNLPRLRLLIKHRTRKPGKRLPLSPTDDIERLLKHISDPTTMPAFAGDDAENLRLREMRDRAFLLTLADTGFRVHEACKLRRGDVDWNEGLAIVIGKGDKEAVVRFSSRSLKALKDYLSLRASMDGGSGRPLSSLPVFVRHDKGAGKIVRPITTTTGRNIVNEHVERILGEESVGKITPHSFRHYFVTSILRVTNNLVKAQKLARHDNIATTERYTHLVDDELDQTYYEVFEERFKKPEE